MNIDFKKQYDNSDITKKGVDIILASDKFTDDYKDLIRGYLGFTDSTAQTTNEITENIIQNVNEVGTFGNDKITVSKSEIRSGDFVISTVKGGLVGYIEKPIYIEDALTKAIDIVVDELISLPPKEKLETILKSLYDIKVNELAGWISDYGILNDKYSQSLSTISTLENEIETLNQVVDSEKILRAVADNETQAANARYTSVLSNFQTALNKGIEEAIARVSLEAQVQGLTAQKEVLESDIETLRILIETQSKQFATQLGNIQTQFDIQIESQQSIFDVQTEQFESQLTGIAAESTAIAAGFTPGSDNEFFYKFERNDGKEWTDGHTWRTSVKSPKNNQFGKLSIQNANDSELVITKVTLSVTGQLANHGPIGFTNARVPSKTKNVNIAAGNKKPILLYAGNNIGGGKSGTPEPNKKNFLNRAHTYTGLISATITYSDGSTEKTDSLSWSFRKTKD